MLVVIIALQAFILGCLAGFWAWHVYIRVQKIYLAIQESREADPGVVKVSKSKVTRYSPPIDLSSDAGGIRRPTPDELRLSNSSTVENIKEREMKVRLQ